MPATMRRSVTRAPSCVPDVRRQRTPARPGQEQRNLYICLRWVEAGGKRNSANPCRGGEIRGARGGEPFFTEGETNALLRACNGQDLGRGAAIIRSLTTRWGRVAAQVHQGSRRRQHEHPDADSPGERPKSSAHGSTTKNTEPVISETSKLVTSRLAGPSATPPR